MVALLTLAALIGTVGLRWPMLLACRFATGIGYSAVLAPSGRLLRRSSEPDERPALFAAQFAPSHACWLVTYPVAGRAMTASGAVPTLLVLSGLGLAALLAAARLWPEREPGAR